MEFLKFGLALAVCVRHAAIAENTVLLKDRHTVNFFYLVVPHF